MLLAAGAHLGTKTVGDRGIDRYVPRRIGRLLRDLGIEMPLAAGLQLRELARLILGPARGAVQPIACSYVIALDPRPRRGRRHRARRVCCFSSCPPLHAA